MFADIFNPKIKTSLIYIQVGPKKAREMWFLTRFYDAVEAEKMGLVNTVVPVSSFSSEEFLTQALMNLGYGPNSIL